MPTSLVLPPDVLFEDLEAEKQDRRQPDPDQEQDLSARARRRVGKKPSGRLELGFDDLVHRDTHLRTGSAQRKARIAVAVPNMISTVRLAFGSR